MTGTPVRGAITPSKIHQRTVAVVRPMSVQQRPETEESSSTIKPCLVDANKPRHKSFR